MVNFDLRLLFRYIILCKTSTDIDMDSQNGDLVFQASSLGIADLEATKIGLVYEELYQHYHVDIIRNKFRFKLQ